VKHEVSDVETLELGWAETFTTVAEKYFYAVNIKVHPELSEYHNILRPAEKHDTKMSHLAEDINTIPIPIHFLARRQDKFSTPFQFHPSL
jgi:hypothetical protein